VGFDLRLLVAGTEAHHPWFLVVAIVAAARGLLLALAAWVPAAPRRLCAGTAAVCLCSSAAQLTLVGVVALGGPLPGLGAASPLAQTLAVAASGSSGVLSAVSGAALLYAAGLLPGLSKLDLLRYVLSSCITAMAVGIVALGISRGESVLPGPPAAVTSVFLGSITLLWHLEGVQVAILAMEGQPIATFSAGPAAATGSAGVASQLSRGARLQGLMLQEEAVQRFLVGRQFFVIFVVYLTAQVTTFSTLELALLPGWATTIFIDTGLPGVMIVLAVAQLMPQLMAAEDPRWFMSLPGCLPTVYLCLGLERLGLTHFAWLCSSIGKRMAGISKTKKKKKQPPLPQPPQPPPPQQQQQQQQEIVE